VSYLLDTDILSNPLKKSPSPVLLRRQALVPRAAQFTTAITVGEMVYGALRTSRPETLLERFEQDLWSKVSILPFDTDAAFIYGRLRRDLEQQGTPIDEADLRIASIALSHGLTLVTGNVRHFARIPGLNIENWLQPASPERSDR
jgi:tRNA(fMet)-specific endonuclease VapC